MAPSPSPRRKMAAAAGGPGASARPRRHLEGRSAGAAGPGGGEPRGAAAASAAALRGRLNMMCVFPRCLGSSRLQPEGSVAAWVCIRLRCPGGCSGLPGGRRPRLGGAGGGAARSDGSNWSASL